MSNAAAGQAENGPHYFVDVACLADEVRSAAFHGASLRQLVILRCDKDRFDIAPRCVYPRLEFKTAHARQALVKHHTGDVCRVYKFQKHFRAFEKHGLAIVRRKKIAVGLSYSGIVFDYRDRNVFQSIILSRRRFPDCRPQQVRCLAMVAEGSLEVRVLSSFSEGTTD